MKESDPFRPRVTLTFELHTWQKGVVHTLTIVMICCKIFGTFFIYYKVVNRTSIWSVPRTGWPLTLSYKLGKCATHRLNMVVVGGQTMQTHCKKTCRLWRYLKVSGKTLDCQHMIVSSIPSNTHHTELLKEDKYWFFSGQMLPCIKF